MQLLKTAQRRHPRNGQLHQKIQNLERQIKNKSKVNYYKVLGLTRSASAREVKKAYHKLATRLHPDRHQHSALGVQVQAEEIFKLISSKYQQESDRLLSV